MKHAQTPLWSLNTDEKCKSEEEGTVNSLFRSQVLSSTGLEFTSAHALVANATCPIMDIGR